MPRVYLNRIFLFRGFSLITGGLKHNPHDGGAITVCQLVYGKIHFTIQYFCISRHSQESAEVKRGLSVIDTIKAVMKGDKQILDKLP